MNVDRPPGPGDKLCAWPVIQRQDFAADLVAEADAFDWEGVYRREEGEYI